MIGHGNLATDETEAQDEIYLHNVKTYEALTESAFQLDLTFWVSLFVGIDDLVILVSASISFVTLTKCLASRLAAVRSNKEVNIFSLAFGKGCLT